VVQANGGRPVRKDLAPAISAPRVGLEGRPKKSKTAVRNKVAREIPPEKESKATNQHRRLGELRSKYAITRKLKLRAREKNPRPALLKRGKTCRGNWSNGEAAEERGGRITRRTQTEGESFPKVRGPKMGALWGYCLKSPVVDNLKEKGLGGGLLMDSASKKRRYQRKLDVVLN